VPICVCIVYTQGSEKATAIPYKTSISFTIVCRPSFNMTYTRCYMFISDAIIYGKPNSNLDGFDWTHLIN
jgi:hypothetical protein